MLAFSLILRTYFISLVEPNQPMTPVPTEISITCYGAANGSEEMTRGRSIVCANVHLSSHMCALKSSGGI